MKFINTLEDLFPKFGAKMTCKHFQTVGPGQHLATTPAHALHLNCPWCEIDRLKGNLSLAEEGLANYAQENAALQKRLNDWYTVEAQIRTALVALVGDDVYLKAIANVNADAVAHNPRLAVPQTCRIDSVSGNAYSDPNGKDESGTAPGTARETREAGPKEV